MNDQFVKIPRSLIETLPTLPNPVIRLMLVLYSRLDEVEGTSTVTRPDLETSIGLKRRAVFKALRYAENRGWIERPRESSDSHARNL